MAEQQEKKAATPETESEKLCFLLYGIFAIGLIMQFINLITIVLGSAAVLAGIILTYIERGKTRGTIYENHLQWLIRTFWIGGAVYLPVLTVAGIMTLLMTMDRSALTSAFSTGEGTVEGAVQEMMRQNSDLIYYTMLGYTAPFGIWWLWRCWYGYKRLKDKKTIPNVESWI